MRMAGVGGAGIESTIRRILKTVLSDHVAKMYNWKGRDKLSFEKTNVVRLIYGNSAILLLLEIRACFKNILLQRLQKDPILM